MGKRPLSRRSRRALIAAVLVAAAELGLRVAGLPRSEPALSAAGDAAVEYQADSETGWVNRAGVFPAAAANRSPVRHTNWTQGRRATSPHEPAPDDARPRWIILGDSDAYGAGIADADTFAWRIRQAHPEIQVDNYGTPDYGTLQSFISMTRALDKTADGVSVFYLFNGSHEDRNVADPNWTRGGLQPIEGMFFPYAVLQDGALEIRRLRGETLWGISRTMRTAAMVEDYYDIAEAFPRVHRKRAVTQAILIRMQHLALLSGAKFTVILFDLDAKDRAAYRDFLSSRDIAFLDCARPELNDTRMRQPNGLPGAKLNALLAGWIEDGLATARNR